MDITSHIHFTGRNVTADRGFSSIGIAKELYERDVTYVGTIKKNSVGIPAKAKKFKDREIAITEFYWKPNSPIMLLSYYAKKTSLYS